MLAPLRTSRLTTQLGMERYNKVPPPTPVEATWDSRVHGISLSDVQDRLYSQNDDKHPELTHDTTEDSESDGLSGPNSPPGLYDFRPFEHIMPPADLNRSVCISF